MRRAQRKKGSYERIFKEYRSRTFKFASRNFYSEFLAAREAAKQARAEARAAAKAARKATKEAKTEKVAVCHKPGTPAQGTLEIGASALDAHQRIGKKLAELDEQIEALSRERKELDETRAEARGYELIQPKE